MARQKFKVDDHVRANNKAPGDYEGRSGVVIDVSRSSRGAPQYGVRFPESPGQAVEGYFDSWMLDSAK